MTIRSRATKGLLGRFITFPAVLPEIDGEGPTLTSPGLVLGREPLRELVIICKSNIPMCNFRLIQHFQRITLGDDANVGSSSHCGYATHKF